MFKACLKIKGVILLSMIVLLPDRLLKVVLLFLKDLTMKKYIALLTVIIICGCTHLSGQERNQLQELKAKGVDVEHGSDFDAPANPAAAGALNLLPGGGNFYLAAGNGGDSSHWLYGFLNLLTWPVSIIWGVPEAAVDANRINERELIYYYKYTKKELL